METWSEGCEKVSAYTLSRRVSQGLLSRALGLQSPITALGSSAALARKPRRRAAANGAGNT
eukprot:7377988-Prymnesium_polylepis.1